MCRSLEKFKRFKCSNVQMLGRKSLNVRLFECLIVWAGRVVRTRDYVQEFKSSNVQMLGFAERRSAVIHLNRKGHGVMQRCAKGVRAAMALRFFLCVLSVLCG